MKTLLVVFLFTGTIEKVEYLTVDSWKIPIINGILPAKMNDSYENGEHIRREWDFRGGMQVEQGGNILIERKDSIGVKENDKEISHIIRYDLRYKKP